jgi:Tol biopolymer transport system component
LTEAAVVPSPSPVVAAASAVPSPSPSATATPTRLLVARQIAFLSDRDNQRFQVYLLDPDTLNVTPVKTDLDVLDVVLSPDGKRLLIGAFEPPLAPTYYIANVDGSGETQLTDRQAQHMPVWSPDGARLAFSASIEGTAAPQIQVFVVNADGSGEVQVTGDTTYLHTDPTWSPDGKRLAYILRETAEPGQPNHGVGFGVVNSDGAGETIVAGGSATPITIDDSLKWSPDGERLAFQRGVFSFDRAPLSGDEGIYVINVDGTGLTQLASLQNPPPHYAQSLDNLAWSPDGAHIAYKDGSTLYVIDASGGSTRPLLVIRDPNQCTQYVLSPVWLADGQRIAYDITGPAFAETFADFEIHIAHIDGSSDINATNNAATDWFFVPIAGGGC